METLRRQVPRIAVVMSIGAIFLLVWVRVLNVVALAVLELLLLAAVLWSGARMWRRYRSVRDEGVDVWQAMEEGLALLLPRRVASFVALEPLIWLCLFRWVFRRRKPDADAFGYSQGSIVGVFVIALLFSAPVEILLVELLIPWHWLKVLFLVLDAYSMIWLLGYATGIAVLPHRMTARGVRVYYGIGAHGFLPYSAIDDVRRQRLTITRRDGCHVDAQGQTASLSVGGVTTVTLRLNQPITLRRIFDSTSPITTLHLAVDEPERFVTTLEHRLAQHHDTMSAPVGNVSLEVGSAR